MPTKFRITDDSAVNWKTAAKIERLLLPYGDTDVFFEENDHGNLDAVVHETGETLFEVQGRDFDHAWDFATFAASR